jgi:hypothetical protein
MTKDWAFTSETGFGRMTAAAASRIRWAKYGGAPLPDSYKFWSTDSVGSRQRLKHVQTKDIVPFFSYHGNSVLGGSEGGESLSHEFYKIAITRLTKTQLQLKNGHYGKPQLRLKDGDYEIRITHAETEKTIHLPTGQYYRPDVYCRFECDQGLSTKWSGELYIEVWHMHRVAAEKIKNLKANRIPVIQVKVPDAWKYPYDGVTTTDEREEKYIAGMVGRLEQYMTGFVLSDPNCVENLEKQVLDLAGQIAEHEQSAAANAVEIERLQGTIRTMADDVRSLRGERERQVSELIELKRKAILEEEKLRGLKDAIVGLKDERTDLQGALKARTKALFVTSGLGLLSAFMGTYALLDT